MTFDLEVSFSYGRCINRDISRVQGKMQHQKKSPFRMKRKRNESRGEERLNLENSDVYTFNLVTFIVNQEHIHMWVCFLAPSSLPFGLLVLLTFATIPA